MAAARGAEGVVEVDEADAIEYAFEQGWTDGLPVVPPTPERVARMLGGRDPDQVVGPIPPRLAVATLEKVAINAVMAGCKPEYFPVVLAALKAMLREPFNLTAIHATTHSATPLIVVNGPAVKQLGFNAGHNVFGQGWRANATVGRAVRLVGVNIGGALPGEQDKATHGHPGKYTYCIAELEEANPWEPLHVQRGFARDDSVVTVFAGEAPHAVDAHGATEARGVLAVVASTMSTTGTNNARLMGEVLIVLGPEHADTIARSGWTLTDVQHYLFEHARNRVRDLRIGGNLSPENVRMCWPKWLDPDDDDARIPIVKDPRDILVLVAGGAGKFSAFIPGWGDLGSRATSERIDLPDE